MVRTRFALLLPLLLILPVAAMAQAAAPETGDASATSESHIAAALDLMKANHTVDNLNAMFDAMAPIETAQIKREHPNLSDAVVALIVQKVREAVTTRQDEMLRLYALVYARHFTEEELHGLSAFYRSDLGQKYITAVPSLISEATPLIAQWMTGLAAQLQQDILQSLPKQPPANKS